VIWIMNIVLFVILYFDMLKGSFSFFNRIKTFSLFKTNQQ
jgi:hypothetical protein